MCTKIFRVIFITLITMAFAFSLVLAQEKEKKAEKKEGKKTECQTRLKTNDDTEKLVKSTIAEVEKLKPKGQAEKDLKDAKEWYDKAKKKHEELRKQVEKGKCDEKILKDLGWVWQWYVKAATSAVNAKLALPQMKTGREKKEKKK